MLEFSLGSIKEDLSNFQAKLSAVDMDSVEQEALKRSAGDLAEMVRLQAIDAEEFETPSLNSKWTGKAGGISMSQKRAWKVDPVGDKYVVRPAESVRERAVILEFGSTGPITSKSGKPMPVEIEGEMHFFDSVSGVDEAKYWRTAIKEFVSSEKMTENMRLELNKELEEHF